MGCRLTKDQQFSLSIVHFNMLVVGFSEVGKTKLLSVIKGEQNDEKNTLQINTITINKSLKLMTFQVSGKAEKTWKNYYSIADIVMFVIDVNDGESISKVREKLFQIDSLIKKSARIFIVFNKVDKLVIQQRFNDTETTKQINQEQKSTVLAQNLLNKLHLHHLTHQWTFGQCSAETGDGIKPFIKKLHEFVVLKRIQKAT